MTLKQLKYLVGIADSGLNITAAAERLFTSQPGISKQLKQLEAELKVQLFTRKGKSLTAITPAVTTGSHQRGSWNQARAAAPAEV